MKKIIILLIIFLLTGCGRQVEKQNIIALNEGDNQKQKTDQTTEKNIAIQTVHFAKYNPLFRFQASFPKNWQVEYVPEITSLNIYDPTMSAQTSREKSQIFIRYFEANDFLTLNTVDILGQTETTINNHSAVSYEIKKKSGIADFPHQPNWRNFQHKLIDIRLTKNNPSLFYVFSYNPELDQSIFEAFINSLIFDNGPAAWQQPLDNAEKRITKKPFSLQVSPTNSPVNPEKFSGYHTGTDFEILAEEENTLIPVKTICGGKLLQAKSASGYGGVIVQLCLLNDQPITVIYGHLKLDSLTKKTGDYLSPGEFLTYLGDGYSTETDGERKHLHLGIHLGSEVNIAGYVQKESQLNDWLDYQKIK